MNRFTYIRPKTIEDALLHLNTARGESCLLAGGTDVVRLMREGLMTPKEVVSLKSVPGIREVAYTAGTGLSIGAGATITAIATHPEINLRYPMLALAARSVGTPQIRNMGTLGGNLLQKNICCYYHTDCECPLKGSSCPCPAIDGENKKHALFGGGPCFAVNGSDMAIALQAFGANVVLISREGERTLPIGEFYKAPNIRDVNETYIHPDEILTGVQIPDIPLDTPQLFTKAKECGEWHTPLASLAITLTGDAGFVSGASIILGGVAPKPWRAESAEFTLMGAALNETIAEQAGEAAIEGAKPLAHNGYKLTLIRNIVRDAALQLAGEKRQITA